MKILFCADVSAAKIIGGAERVLFEQSSRLSDHGNTVYILTRKYPHHSSQREMLGKVEEWRYPVRSSNSVNFLISTLVNSRNTFDRMLNQGKFNVVNAHQPFTAYGILSSLKKHKIPLFYTCLSLSFEEYISRNRRKIKKISPSFHLNIFLRKIIEKRVLQQADQIIVLSDYTRQSIIKNYGLHRKPINVVPAGVDLIKFQPLSEKLVVQRELNIPSGKFVLFTVRNLVPRMGLENLIDAISILIKRIPDIFLIIGGEGPLKDDLKQQVEKSGLKNCIRFEGFVNDHKLPSYYHAADAFVLPTKELEGFGLITLEALASGIPVFGTPVGGTIELLNRFDKDFLSKDISAEAIAESILSYRQKLRKKPTFADEISQRCRDFAERYYSWDQNIGRVESLLMESVKPKLT